jgi:DNA repair protein RecN (Recombination protein N)
VTTTVAEVRGDARAHEIARMLSGSESEASLDHARELLASSSLT